ncbi:MAG TPA: class I SAM-dependent methyltransferase [Drouetiella sp.]
MKLKGSYEWPKKLPDLTDEQIKIKDDFMRYWHEQLASTKSYEPLENFNHGYTVRNSPPGFVRTLEIGAGLGEHLVYEKLDAEQRRNYIPVELRTNMVEKIRERFPDINAQQGDVQGRLDFEDGYFDRIIAVHVLEHLPDLPATVKEMYRLCNKEQGIFSVVIPCEGGMAYNLARYISTEQMFRKRYGQPYKWFIDSEHISIPDEIIKEVSRYFECDHKEFFPFMVPITDINLVIGLTFKPRKGPVPVAV